MSGKVAVVTGGSRGLGRAMSLGLAQAGADIVVASRNREACEQVAAEIERSTGQHALPVACHVGDWAQIEGLVSAANGLFGRIDVLVNNAGMSPLYPSVIEVSEQLFDKVIGVNLKGPFRLTALVGDQMLRAGGGSIINVGSVGSIRPDPRSIPYSAAKAGLNSMTISFAHALGPRVRVNCILAGPFLTDVSAHWDMAQFERRAAELYALGVAGCRMRS